MSNCIARLKLRLRRITTIVDAREAHANLVSGLSELQASFAVMNIRLTLAAQRFPQLWHIALTLLGFILCVVGIIVIQRQSSLSR